MSEDLFEYPIKEPWHRYPWLFKPYVVKTLIVLITIICAAAILISFIGIPKDAQMITPGLEKIPVPIALSIIILFILPLPCLVVASVLAIIPLGNVPYKLKLITFFLITSLLLESYALKELIAATIHG